MSNKNKQEKLDTLNSISNDVSGDWEKESKEMKKQLTCLDFNGILNEPHSKCEICGRYEWEHKL